MLQQVLLGLIILSLTATISFELVFFIKSQYRGIDEKYCVCKGLTQSDQRPRMLPRILNGHPVGEKDLNYIAAIFDVERVKGRWITYHFAASGTVLNNRFILTAPYTLKYHFQYKYDGNKSHILKEMRLDDMAVGVGLNHDLENVIKNPKHLRKVKKHHVHPNFDFSKIVEEEKKLSESKKTLSLEIEYDISILELKTSLVFGEETNIYPACLIEMHLTDFNRFIFAGFGLQAALPFETEPEKPHKKDKKKRSNEEIGEEADLNSDGEQKNNTIKEFMHGGYDVNSDGEEIHHDFDKKKQDGKLKFTYLYQNKCNNSYAICAFSSISKPMDEDEGGPLILELGKLYIVGLLSRIDGPYDDNHFHNFTSVFTPVYPYMSWINDQIYHDRCYNEGKVFKINPYEFAFFNLIVIFTCLIAFVILSVVSNECSFNNLDPKFLFLKSKANPQPSA